VVVPDPPGVQGAPGPAAHGPLRPAGRRQRRGAVSRPGGQRELGRPHRVARAVRDARDRPDVVRRLPRAAQPERAEPPGDLRRAGRAHRPRHRGWRGSRGTCAWASTSRPRARRCSGAARPATPCPSSVWTPTATASPIPRSW
jgi:hypothetical protein